MAIFQNNKQHQGKVTLSKSDFNINYKQESLKCLFACQILNKYHLKKRAKIPTNLQLLNISRFQIS